MVLLGKYLTPELYISYGKSLFTESQQVRARYRFNKQWEIESKISADATGGDLYYRIELD
jgi:translocation and assembly module TamB